MTPATVKTRPTGATAKLGRIGQPAVTSVTGGELTVVSAPSQPGFNPLDLLYASLSACIVLSARIAASKFGVLDKLAEARATVTGTKAIDGPSRVERFHVTIEIDGVFDAAMRQRIIAEAEAICTVSNTLRGSPAFETAEHA